MLFYNQVKTVYTEGNGIIPANTNSFILIQHHYPFLF